MNIKNVYILDDRAILYLNGEDTKEFLQNLISNDINKVSDTTLVLLLCYLLKENFYMNS